LSGKPSGNTLALFYLNHRRVKIMFYRTTRNLLAALLLALLLAVPGCKYFSKAAADQTADANKLQDEADKLASKVDEAYNQATQKEDAIKAEKKAKSRQQLNDEETAIFDQAIADAKSAAEKYEQASKLKIDEKYKQYLDLRAQLMRKEGAHLSALKELPTARKDTSRQGQKTLRDKQADIKTRSDKLKKEVDDLRAQADKMQKENGDKFKAKTA
jgi:chromosome segregation ATPase